MIKSLHHKPACRKPTGVATVFAVTMLAIMFTLSAALWAGVAASRRMAKNDRDTSRAMAAAETGVNYVNSLIGRTRLKEKDAYGREVIRQWHTKLANLNPRRNDDDTVLTVSNIVPHPGSSQRFSATFSIIGPPDAKKPPMNLRVTGTDLASGIRRSISVNLNPLDTTDRIFRYGVASKGRIDLAKGKSNLIGSPDDAGSILSTYPYSWAIWLAGGRITGDVAVVGDPSVSFINEGGAVTGKVVQVDAPEFPEFCPNQYYSTALRQLPDPNGNNNGPYYNVRIEGDFTFNGNDTIEGLIYVKPGANLSFQGNPVVKGVIVVEDPNLDANGDPIPDSHLMATSKLSFQGVPTFDTPVWPNDGKLSDDQKRELGQYSVLGPTAFIYISGSGGGNSDKDGFARSVVCGTLAEYGSGIVPIRDGALVSMSDTAAVGIQGVSCWLEGDGVQILRTPAYTVPQGGYTHRFSWVIDSSTYSEIVEEQ